MVASAASRPITPVPAWAAGVCTGVHAAGIRDVVYVPDNPLSHVLREFGQRFADVRLVLATREEEAFGIAAGLYLGGRRAAGILRSHGGRHPLHASTSLLDPHPNSGPRDARAPRDAGQWQAPPA